MKTFIAFSLLVAAVLAEPQFYYSGVVPGAGYYPSGVYPGAYGVAPYVAGSPVVTKSVYSPYVAPAVTPYVAVPYPSQDTSRGLPQPVQDTPEVKHAKAVFTQQYEKAAVAAAVGHRFKRDLTAVYPVKTPASTTPLTYAASPVVASPYYASAPHYYGAYAGVAPYASYAGYAGVAPYSYY